jgi:formylglycine-generating enzyme required for sulfatase activity
MIADQGPTRAEYLIRTCGVRIPFTKELEADLKEAGAEPNVIQAVREVAPQPAAPKIEAPKPPPGPTAGRIVTNRKDGLPYAYIPPGRFRMGCSEGDTECFKEESPPHNVTITKGFWMGQTEVTVEAYKRFTKATGRAMPSEPIAIGDKNLNPGWNNDGVPMTMVTWIDAHEYCEWAGLRLPTEAEWEYAARAGSTGSRYGSLDSVAWYGDNSGDKTLDTASIWKDDQKNYFKRVVENGNHPHPVGQKQANAFRLYDMLGNVWEWTADWYKETYYGESPEEDPQGPPGGELRVLRGGSWGNPPVVVRVSYRVRNQPSVRINGNGFRCSGELQVP